MKWHTFGSVCGKGIVCALLMLPLPAFPRDNAEPGHGTGRTGYTDSPVEKVAKYLDDIRAPQAWKRLKNKSPYRKIDLGIIDGGFHGLREGAADFEGRLHDIPPEGDGETHGAIAAAVAAATGNNIRTSNVGVNWTSEVFLGLGLYSSRLSRSFGAMVKQGVKVINISLGGGQPESTGNGKCEAGEAAQQLRFIRDVAVMIDTVNAFSEGGEESFLVVVAAGNDGCDLGRDLGDVGKPGNLLVVGGSRDGAGAGGSNRGELIDLAAPFDVQQQYSYADKSYRDYSGTSYAAPQVAGAAALVWAYDPQLRTSGQVIERLKKTARYAIPEFGKAGVLDVYGALTGKKAPLDKTTEHKRQTPKTREKTQRPERVY